MTTMKIEIYELPMWCSSGVFSSSGSTGTVVRGGEWAAREDDVAACGNGTTL